jgi:hypothetical protein
MLLETNDPAAEWPRPDHRATGLGNAPRQQSPYLFQYSGALAGCAWRGIVGG